MVKIGFIVEGDCEKLVVEAQNFRDFLKHNGFELVTPVINAEGGGNLLPHNIEPFVQQLQGKGADKIFVLTDLENDDSPEIVRKRIEHEKTEFAFIAVKALEAWFLADTEAMRKFLKTETFEGERQPENTEGMPWDRLSVIAKETEVKQGRGTNKVLFAKKMVKHWGFSIENAAKHENCPSAKELVDYFSQ